jgi:hypothetical protein
MKFYNEEKYPNRNNRGDCERTFEISKKYQINETYWKKDNTSTISDQIELSGIQL